MVESKDSCVQKEDQTFTVSASVSSKDLKAMAPCGEGGGSQEAAPPNFEGFPKWLEAKHGELQGIMMALGNNDSIKPRSRSSKSPAAATWEPLWLISER